MGRSAGITSVSGGSSSGEGTERHRVLVFETHFVGVERASQVEDRPAVLDRDDAPVVKERPSRLRSTS